MTLKELGAVYRQSAALLEKRIAALKQVLDAEDLAHDARDEALLRRGLLMEERRDLLQTAIYLEGYDNGGNA